MKRKPVSQNPWGARKAQRRNRILAAAVAAVALGATIGLIWPNSLLPGARKEAKGQLAVIYNPAPVQVKRTDSPTPLPAVDEMDAAQADGPVVQINFGYCAGRSGTNCVIDGDTFIIEDQTIRLASIDTPEIGGARCPDERRRGKAAEERLHELLNSGPVQIVRSGGRNQDRYGRFLRDAEVNGLSVSGQLVSEGHARRWSGAKESWC